MSILKLLGGLCYAFTVIDVAASWLGTDITGVFWSPLVACVLGYMLMNAGGNTPKDYPYTTKDGEPWWSVGRDEEPHAEEGDGDDTPTEEG